MSYAMLSMTQNNGLPIPRDPGKPPLPDRIQSETF